MFSVLVLQLNPIHDAWVSLSNSSNWSNWTNITSFWKKLDWFEGVYAAVKSIYSEDKLENQALSGAGRTDVTFTLHLTDGLLTFRVIDQTSGSFTCEVRGVDKLYRLKDEILKYDQMHL